MRQAIKSTARTRGENRISKKLFATLGRPCSPEDYKRHNAILGEAIDRIAHGSNMHLVLNHAVIAANRSQN